MPAIVTVPRVTRAVCAVLERVGVLVANAHRFSRWCYVAVARIRHTAGVRTLRRRRLMEGMGLMKRVGDLEIDEDLTFQEREWTVQRIGWVTMMLVIVAALLGLFGTGPLSAATAGDAAGPLSVEYQRFVRHDGRTTLTMRVESTQGDEGEAEVWLAADYVRGVEVQHISPEPQEVRADGDRYVYVFAVADPAEPVEVSFSLKPRQIGRLSGEAGIPGGSLVTFNQISYP